MRSSKVGCVVVLPGKDATQIRFVAQRRGLQPEAVGRIPMLSVTERAVYGASMSPLLQLWLNSPNSLACSR